MDIADVLPASSAHHRRVRRVRILAALLDNALTIPGLRIPIGLDPVLGLFPGWGDAVGALAGLYIVFEGWRMGATWPVLARMVANLALDAAVGAIPVLGDLFDLAWQANTRNLRLLGIEPLDSTPRR